MYDYSDWKKRLVIVRGGGDIATGTIYKLYQCGFPVLVLEIENPSCIRRTVSFCEAVTEGETTVEGVTARKAKDIKDAHAICLDHKIPVMVDPLAKTVRDISPPVLVDGILAKRNLGTRITDAPAVIGLGPGFTAGQDVHAVIETKRGHRLGRVIYEGSAAPNTGVPGVIAGYGKERVIRAPAGGIWHIKKDIGEQAGAGEIIAFVDDIPVTASIPGIVRGTLREGYPVKKGLKAADIDPRLTEKENCRLISDKARCVAGGTLEAILHLCSL